MVEISTVVENDGDDNQKVPSSTTQSSSNWLSRMYMGLAADPMWDAVLIILLLAAETVLGYFIIEKVAYTEIDWVAYMQEVEAWLIHGEHDYRNIVADTGPLVYPAGFLYLFAAIRKVTNDGTNVRAAQYLFLGIYLATQATVLMIYREVLQEFRRISKTAKNGTAGSAGSATTATATIDTNTAHCVWIFRVSMGLLCLSKRIHSIFVLRLFNDGPCMLLLYGSVWLMMRHYWKLGCTVFSLAVSIKMNVLLFAPALLLLLLQVHPNLWSCVWHIAVYCGMPQLVLGWPFLSTFPVSYLRKAFELDRVFFYKWTVNWKFLPEDVFLNKNFGLALLFLHLRTLYGCAQQWKLATEVQLIRAEQAHPKPQQQRQRTSHRQRPPITAWMLGLFLPTQQNQNPQEQLLPQVGLSPSYIAYTMFVANFVGICFSKTLHYQFYVWYFHSLPFLLGLCLTDKLLQPPSSPSNNPSNNIQYTETRLPFVVSRVLLGLAALAALERSFLTFPATPASSLALQVAHLYILMAILRQPPDRILEEVATTVEDGKAKTQ